MIAAIYGNHKRLLLLSARIEEFLRAAVVFFFVALMTFMGRKWEMKEFGIAVGFGLDVAISLASVAFWSQASKRSSLVSRIPVIAYDIACIIWIYCFLDRAQIRADSSYGASSQQKLFTKRKNGKSH